MTERTETTAPDDEPRLEGVPRKVVPEFLRGLDDAKNGRTRSIDETLAEGRRRIAAYRAGVKS